MKDHRCITGQGVGDLRIADACWGWERLRIAPNNRDSVDSACLLASNPEEQKFRLPENGSFLAQITRFSFWEVLDDSLVRTYPTGPEISDAGLGDRRPWEISCVQPSFADGNRPKTDRNR